MAHSPWRGLGLQTEIGGRQEPGGEGCGASRASPERASPGHGRRAPALLRALRRRREGGERATLAAAPGAGSAGGTCGARPQQPEPRRKGTEPKDVQVWLIFLTTLSWRGSLHTPHLPTSHLVQILRERV